VTGTIESLRRKIVSAGDLQAVVRTMKAMAAANIGQYQKSVGALADYYRTVQLGLSVCLHRGITAVAPVRALRGDSAGAPRAIVFGSDQGLVGQFNEVVADFAIRALAAVSRPCQVWAVGERVYARLIEGRLPMAGLFAVPNSVQAITALVGELQIKTGVHRDRDPHAPLWVFHNRPVSGSLYEPVSQCLLPLDLKWQNDLTHMHWPTPNLPEVTGDGLGTLRALIHEYLFISLFRACSESLAGENASRLAAMERADKNISELSEQLHGGYHQLRQRGIDEELFDVISGFEALRGVQQPPIE
jgi:F-type H+-transporting ATPase subunit gamma